MSNGINTQSGSGVTGTPPVVIVGIVVGGLVVVGFAFYWIKISDF